MSHMSQRRDRLATLAIHKGWRLAWANTPNVGTVNKFTIECWFKGARVMLVQAWHDGDGVTTYFQGGGETWEQLEAELADDMDGQKLLSARGELNLIIEDLQSPAKHNRLEYVLDAAKRAKDLLA